MAVGVSLSELLTWNDETATRWQGFLRANPQVAELPAGIYAAAHGGTETVLGVIRHIVAAELRYARCLRALPVPVYGEIPEDDVDAVFAVHQTAVAELRDLLAVHMEPWWDEKMAFMTLTAGEIQASRRKILSHAVLHGIRHWAQLATLARTAGYPTGFSGDLMMSSALK